MYFDLGLRVSEITPVLWAWEVWEIFPPYDGSEWMVMRRRGTAPSQALATAAGEAHIDKLCGRSQ